MTLDTNRQNNPKSRKDQPRKPRYTTEAPSLISGMGKTTYSSLRKRVDVSYGLHTQRLAGIHMGWLLSICHTQNAAQYLSFQHMPAKLQSKTLVDWSCGFACFSW